MISSMFISTKRTPISFLPQNIVKFSLLSQSCLEKASFRHIIRQETVESTRRSKLFLPSNLLYYVINGSESPGQPGHVPRARTNEFRGWRSPGEGAPVTFSRTRLTITATLASWADLPHLPPHVGQQLCPTIGQQRWTKEKHYTSLINVRRSAEHESLALSLRARNRPCSSPNRSFLREGWRNARNQCSADRRTPLHHIIPASVLLIPTGTISVT